MVDVGKAFLVSYFIPGLFENPSPYRLLFGVVVILGNIFSPYLRFKGGKGVATGLGVAIAMSPISIAIAIGVFTVVVAAFQYMSLGSLTAAVSFTTATLLLPVGTGIFSGQNIYPEIFSILLLLMVIISHISNIKRLIRGEENKIGTKKQK